MIKLLSKVVGIWKNLAQNLSPNSKKREKCSQNTKIREKLLLEFLEFLENKFSRNSRKKLFWISREIFEKDAVYFVHYY
jgi:hypothetical protein